MREEFKQIMTDDVGKAEEEIERVEKAREVIERELETDNHLG